MQFSTVWKKSIVESENLVERHKKRNLTKPKEIQQTQDNTGVMHHPRIARGAVGVALILNFVDLRNAMHSQAALGLTHNNRWGWPDGHNEVHTCENYYLH